MRPSEIRDALIREHGELRSLAAEVRRQAERVVRGDTDELAGLREALVRLGAALHAHNRHEEALLRDEIRTIDAWGPQREALMDEHHASEHAEAERALGELTRGDDGASAMASGSNALVDKLLQHMLAEEKDLLHPDLLRDDVVTIQGFSG